MKNKIKFIVLLTICTLLTTSFSTLSTAIAASNNDDFVIEYQEGKGNVLTSYIGTSPHVIIPDNVDELSSMAFCRNDIVQSIVVPSSVKYIQLGAFRCCDNLQEITFLNSNVVHRLGGFDENPCSDLACDCITGSLFGQTYTDSIVCGLENITLSKHYNTLTIKGYAGSTAEKAINVLSTLDSNPYDSIVFISLDNSETKNEQQQNKDEDTNINTDTTSVNAKETNADIEKKEPDTDTKTEESTETNKNNDSAIDKNAVNNDISGNDIGNNESKNEKQENENTNQENSNVEHEEKPVIPEVTSIHHKGTKGTSFAIHTSSEGYTYPYKVCMKVGSYYVLELGNLPEGYTYSIQGTNSSLCEFDEETNTITALQEGLLPVKILVKDPTGSISRTCKIYIEGE